MRCISIIIWAAVAAAGAGCARENVSPMPSISEQARASLGSPVNCSTAREDIALLEGERASVGQRALAGVRAVFPVSAVAGLLSGDYSDRTAVATGQYNADIDAKIREIRAACRL